MNRVLKSGKLHIFFHDCREEILNEMETSKAPNAWPGAVSGNVSTKGWRSEGDVGRASCTRTPEGLHMLTTVYVDNCHNIVLCIV